MKKIKLFSLLAAMLFAGSTMVAATSYIPQGVKEVKENTIVYAADVPMGTNYTPASNWIGCPTTNNINETKNYTNVTDNTTGGNPKRLTDNIASATSVTMSKLAANANVYNSDKKVIHMHVKGISEIIVHGITGSEKRGMAIGCNEFTNELTEKSPILESASVQYTESKVTGSFIVNLANLDSSKEYVISIWAVGGDAYFYAAELIAGVLTPTLTSFTINEVEAVIDDKAKTITAVLPYGTAIDWKSVAVVLGGTATQWLINEEHTQLTISNAEGMQNVVYTLNITVAEPSHNATLSAITVDEEALEGFTSERQTYDIELAYGTTLIPTVAATTTDEKATYTVTYVDAEGEETNDLPCIATIEVTAEDGSTKQTYTIKFTISTTASTDATLSDITLDGVSIADFASATTAYTVELAYIANVPAIKATPTHAAATVVVDAPVLAKGEIGKATITVTAQDGTTTEVYTISFTRATAEVAKLYEVIFSNEAKGAIDATAKTVTVPYLADTEEAVVPTTEESKITVQGAGATVALNESNQIVMTSADDVETIFTIVGAPLVPKELGNETVTFDGTEKYFFAPAGYSYTESKPYGWVSNRNAETDKPRITTGLCRMYIALPACTSATLFTGTNKERKAQLYVNGVNEGAVTFPKQNSYKIENLNATSANFIGIENISGSEGGDLGFVNITLTGAKEVETSFEQAQVEAKAMKVIRDGQLLIIRDGKTYTAQGVQVQ